MEQVGGRDGDYETAGSQSSRDPEKLEAAHKSKFVTPLHGYTYASMKDNRDNIGVRLRIK